MADTVFVDGVTLTDDDWFNDVNRLHYTILGDPANAADVLTALGTNAVVAASDTVSGILEVAIQSEMETGTDVVRAVTPGRQQFHDSAAKAWANWNSAGTIADSFNVSSVTDNGVGDFTVNFTVAFSSASYVAAYMAGDGGSSAMFSHATVAAGSINMICRSPANPPVDRPPHMGVFFGDQ